MAQGPAYLPSLGLVLNQKYTLQCSAGQFLLSGQAATLNYVGPNSVKGPAYLPSIGLLLEAVGGNSSPGAFTLTGRDAALRNNHRLIGAAGSFALLGQAALFNRVGQNTGGNPAPLPHLGLMLGANASNKFLVCDAGPFAVTGVAAGLQAGAGMTAETGSFLISGAPAERDLEMNGDTGTFAVSGVAALLKQSYPLFVGEAGAFVVTGNSAFTVYEAPGRKVLPCEAGSFLVAGQEALFSTNPFMNADVGTFIVAGQEATLSWSGETFEAERKKGGRGKKKRERKKLVVTIDGEDFFVESAEEAEALLAQAREIYEEQIKSIRVKKAPIRLPKIRASGPDGPERDALVAEVSALRIDIKALYEEALAALDDRLDDEEALALLL